MRFRPFLSFRRARSQQVAMLGALSVLAAFGGWGCPATSSISNGPAISGTEFAYITNQSDNTVSAYAVNANAGTLASIGTTNVGKSPSKIVSVSLGPKSNYVYVLNQQDSTVSQFTVNANGTLTPLRVCKSITSRPCGKPDLCKRELINLRTLSSSCCVSIFPVSLMVRVLFDYTRKPL